jgi:hypothetical protein
VSLFIKEWLYERTDDNSARFVLGTVGENPLCCFGINPSTAEPGRLDPTVATVERKACEFGYDSFIMFNVYPQRATNPNDLHQNLCEELHRENLRQIAAAVSGRSLDVWAAWGALITKRGYLTELVKSIVSLPELMRCNWVSRGEITKDGHPHHPLYVKNDCVFDKYDISRYY